MLLFTDFSASLVDYKVVVLVLFIEISLPLVLFKALFSGLQGFHISPTLVLHLSPISVLLKASQKALKSLKSVLLKRYFTF